MKIIIDLDEKMVKNISCCETGKWIWDYHDLEYICSKCGCNPVVNGSTPHINEIGRYRFCRNCGARMEV